jgi:hypothetical protein
MLLRSRKNPEEPPLRKSLIQAWCGVAAPISINRFVPVTTIVVPIAKRLALFDQAAV